MIKLRQLFRFSKIQNKSSIDGIIEQRRSINRQLSKEELQSRDLQIFWQSPQTDIVIHLVLYMRHDCHICQKAFSLLNYYNISFDKVDNILFLDFAKKAKIITLEQWQWPVLKVNVSLDSTQFITGPENIVSFLINKELILNQTHMTNTLFAQQGIECILQKIKKPLDLIFLNPILTWQNLFKSSPDSYAKDSKNYLLINYMLKVGYRAFTQSSRNIYHMIRQKEAYFKAQAELLQGLNEWIQRLNGQQFHGGQKPDEADFELFGVIMSRYNSNSFKKYIENKAPFKFYQWILRMQQLCRYDQNRFYANTDTNVIE
ncbi:unnamed protein product [Paramecium pentaurelia]|uniref:Uncharacterized protein n=1 Tax=Paramecium pentaurelia TaxID=43138 RepID=A0A8S1U2H1_9CILI|nr:unnamed protein product [Paramecium pentaurelia]